MLLLLALLGCQDPASLPLEGAPADKTAVVSRNRGVLVTGADYEARARAAWAAAELYRVSEGGEKVAKKVDSPVFVDDPAKFDGLGATVDLRTSPAWAALLGTDEVAAAESIRGAGGRLVVVHRRLGPSFDRDSRVLSRLYHHDHLERFQLARVEDDALFYLVVDAPLEFTPEEARSAMAWVRGALEGRTQDAYPPVESKRSSWRLVATLRGRGQELAFSLAEAATLDKALTEVADDLETMYRRQKEILGFPRLDRAMPGYLLELHRVTETAQVIPRDEGDLEQLWELGVDGAVMLDRPTEAERKAGKKGQSAVWPGAVAVTRGITKVDSFLKAEAREFRWDSVRPWRDADVELQLIRTTHYVEAPAGSAGGAREVVHFVRGTAEVPLSTVTLATVRDHILLAGEWYLANLTPEGQVTYKFWPEENRYSDDYNHVRHTLATWNLWQAWTLDPRPEFLEGAQRAQRWTLRSLQVRDATNLRGWEAKEVTASPRSATIAREGMAYFTHGENTKLGSVVVALLGMVEVARATGDRSLDPVMRQLGNFVMFMQEPSGTFRGYHVPEGHGYHGQANDIVPGEAALALVYLYEYFQDPRYLEPLPKFWSYYQEWYRQRVDKRTPGGVWPAQLYPNATRLELVQFGPWTVMAANAYTRARPEAREVATFGLDVGRWMIASYQYSADRVPFPDYLGSYYKFEGELPAMQAFCYAEGTAAAYAMALRQSPDQAAYFEEHTREAVRFGMAMQHDGLDSRAYARPEQIIGGVRYAMNEPKVRIDYVHHALSAAYQWWTAATSDPGLPVSLRAEPDEALRRTLGWQGMPTWRGGSATRSVGFATENAEAEDGAEE